MKTLILDHYDSFTYILAQYVGELKGNPIVKKNNEISVKEIEKLAPTHLILSPGPGRPEHPKDMGITLKAIERFAKTIPILGVCLGHQAIAHHFGGLIVHAPKVMHGKKSAITHDEIGIFQGISSPLTVMRYHSLIVDRASVPAELEITAETDDKLIMGLRHKQFPIESIQFHPESIGTDHGKKMIKNFLQLTFALQRTHSMLSSPRSLTSQS